MAGKTLLEAVEAGDRAGGILLTEVFYPAAVKSKRNT